MGRLDQTNLAVDVSKQDYRQELERVSDRLLQLRLFLGAQTGERQLGPPLCVLFEGWDASGKGGAIKRLVGPLDPRHVRVVQFGPPTPDELRHHWLSRFWPVLPGWGGMAVLDRSWYGRVLVERLEGLATEEEWQRAYHEIVDFERTLVAEGMILVKFWMHVSVDEQLRRFEARRHDPLKSWKLTPEDWRNREKRAEYEVAVEDMFRETDWQGSVWHIVPGESKRYARLFVIGTVLERIEQGVRTLGVEPPDPVRGMAAADE
ncbi:MAG TPA: UDP-galactose-lipid carrier transferase [Acidimicrobiia bacterium]